MNGLWFGLCLGVARFHEQSDSRRWRNQDDRGSVVGSEVTVMKKIKGTARFKKLVADSQGRHQKKTVSRIKIAASISHR